MTLPSLPEVPRERRRTATVVAVATLSALCLLGLVLGVQGLLADPTSAPRPVPTLAGTTTTPTPSTPAAVTSSPAATPSPATTPAPEDDRVAFSSPSGNISCSLGSDGARCDIAQRDWKPPAKPADCTQDWGRGIAVTADGARVVCSSDGLSRAKTLGYGHRGVRGDFSCTSSKEGMRCEHEPSGHGFEIATGSYRLF